MSTVGGRKVRQSSGPSTYNPLARYGLSAANRTVGAGINNATDLPMPDMGQLPGANLPANRFWGQPTPGLVSVPSDRPMRAVTKPKPSRWKPGERTNRVVTTLGRIAGGVLGGPIGGIAGGPLARGGLELYRKLLAGGGTGGGRGGQQMGPQVPYNFTGFNQLGQGIQTSPQGRRSVIPRAAPVDPNTPVIFSGFGANSQRFTSRAGNSGFGVGPDGRSIVGFNSSGQPLFQGAPPDVVKAAGLYSPVQGAEAVNSAGPDELPTYFNEETGEFRRERRATPAQMIASGRNTQAGRAAAMSSISALRSPAARDLYRSANTSSRPVAGRTSSGPSLSQRYLAALQRTRARYSPGT